MNSWADSACYSLRGRGNPFIQLTMSPMREYQNQTEDQLVLLSHRLSRLGSLAYTSLLFISTLSCTGLRRRVSPITMGGSEDSAIRSRPYLYMLYIVRTSFGDTRVYSCIWRQNRADAAEYELASTQYHCRAPNTQEIMAPRVRTSNKHTTPTV